MTWYPCQLTFKKEKLNNPLVHHNPPLSSESVHLRRYITTTKIRITTIIILSNMAKIIHIFGGQPPLQVIL
jgi:hypothetical protein